MKLIVLASCHSPVRRAGQSFFNMPDQWFYGVFKHLQFIYVTEGLNGNLPLSVSTVMPV